MLCNGRHAGMLQPVEEQFKNRAVQSAHQNLQISQPTGFCINRLHQRLENRSYIAWPTSGSRTVRVAAPSMGLTVSECCFVWMADALRTTPAEILLEKPASRIVNAKAGKKRPERRTTGDSEQAAQSCHAHHQGRSAVGDVSPVFDRQKHRVRWLHGDLTAAQPAANISQMPRGIFCSPPARLSPVISQPGPWFLDRDPPGADSRCRFRMMPGDGRDQR